MLKFFLPLLAVLFVGLKLTGFIQWSWFLVLLPVLILPIVLVAALLIFGVLSYITYKR